MTTPSIRKILVATDFSEASRRAMEHGAEIARVLRAEVVLLHVGELPVGLPETARIEAEGRTQPVREYVENAAASRLATLASEVASAGVPVSWRAEIGVPAHVIDEVGRALFADLVVLGTHGRTGLRRAILGSVAETVVRHCSVPVLTVRAGGTDALTEPEGSLGAELDG